ncbi:MAG: EscU/YscU/HrcU family type III secretion system export apparatus switch protein [Firmicutes bacterium]|jgi:FlhB-like protein|nr:EscU/YscU/HrcU family type III secretion system export apparatus switch protein [Bacillota bacterium]
MVDKKRKIATALKYRKDSDVAPKVVAKGKGEVANNIEKVAEEHNVPVYKDEKLSRQLYNLEIGDTIPEELYNVVAEVLVYIAKIDKSK